MGGPAGMPRNARPGRENVPRGPYETEDALGKVDLGMKLTCESCGARFYDLNKQPSSCPKCGAANARPAIFKSRRSAAAEEREDKRLAAAAAAAKAQAPAEEAEVEAVSDDDDEDDEVIEDTSDLGEDDDVEVPVKSDE